MCFSATASVTASVALTGIGVLALRAARTRGERLFALIPLLFAAQQATEGLIWMSYTWEAPTLRAWATQIYSVFSHLLWPAFVPWTVRALEPVPWRRQVLALLGFGGLVSALFLLASMVATPIEVAPIGGHLEYRSPHFFLPLSLTLYLASTTLGLGMSSRPAIRWFGVLALVSAGLAYAVYAHWFISVWCFFAAVLSVMVYIALASRRAAAPVTP
ncbi:MAG: hypothetical protein J0I71_00865 [Rhodanobacter sp.]|nr:hypothetical protein [Rhodanobacter sp.]OJW43216.1 MAG: hypothetical protein BGO50_08490 [Rhodanobacter sp. 67-28]